MDETKKDETIEIPAKFAKIVEEVEKMSVLELNELVKVFEKKFKAFTTGKSITTNHYERIFFCEVK